jgi:hypothetical protein
LPLTSSPSTATIASPTDKRLQAAAGEFGKMRFTSRVSGTVSERWKYAPIPTRVLDACDSRTELHIKKQMHVGVRSVCACACVL